MKIDCILAKKAQLEKLDLSHELRKADDYITELELSRDLTQTVVHVDCDAFYAAVEQLDRPELRDVPFAVGKGVLTTCNYHARKFGCRSGMAGFVAKKLCPQLIFLPLNFDKYIKKAREVREVFVEYDERFESASLDEAYLNITAYCEEHGMDPEEAVQKMRREIHERTHITVSAGIGANAKLAKIGSNINKPNGQFDLPKDRQSIMKFMRGLPVRKVNGVGRVFERELKALGIEKCGDIYQYRQYLPGLFGEKSFKFLIQCYLGLGRTEVHPSEESERKSVGTERTFGDLKGHEPLRAKLRSIADELEKDMAKAQVKGRTLVLKIKLHTYEVFTRQSISPKALHLADDLYKYALPMLSKLEHEFPDLTLRLMGLRCTHLVNMKKPDVNAFFAVKRAASGESSGAGSPSSMLKRKASSMDDEGEWEQWPDEEFENAAREEREDELRELESLSQEVARKADPTKPADKNAQEEAAEEWWDCPICSRPQVANERDFNEHIDHCLSRQAIREAVKETANASPAQTTSSATQGDSKRAKRESKKDSKTRGERGQTKLCFG